MKRLIPLAAAALVAAAILFHPAGTPRVGVSSGAAGSAGSAGGWSTAPPPAVPRVRRSPAARAVVYVAGAVVRPGVYSVPPDARVGDALARAGGGRPEADLVAVNLAARLHDGDEIAVPVRGAAPPPRRGAAARGEHARSGRGAHTARSGRGSHRRGRRNTEPPAEPVDLNRADAATLETLPGIGPALADRIVAFRELNGPFAGIDELLDVSGVTPRRLDDVSPYLVVR